MRGIGGSTLRGGQTVFHAIRMWGQLFRAAMLFAAFTTVAVPAWTLWQRTTGAEWYAAGMVTLAEAKLVLGYDPDSGQEVRFEDGTRRTLRIRDIAASVPAREAREKIKGETFASAGLGALAGGGLIGLFLVAFWVRGAQLGRQKRIRGAEMVTAGELRRRVQPPHHRALARLPGGKRLRPYSIAGIPYPERTETQHTIVSGTTGSGKTVLISDLVSQIRAKGERCVIYDKMGSYTRSFFDKDRDVLMNPLDARAPRWSPFLEARNPRDFDMMAAALIPQQKDTVDPFWVTAARQLFSNGAGVLRQKGVKDNKVLVDHLLKTDLTALAQAMEGTVAQSIVDPENPKTALSVRAMLTANLGALEFLPDTGKPFSIREWNRDAELPRLVHEVLGDAGAGERDDAFRQEVQQVVVAAEGCGASVPVPIRLADDLLDAVALCPACRDLLDAGAATMHKHHVGVFLAGLVQPGDDGGGVGNILPAGDGDKRSVGKVRRGLAVLAGAHEVAGVDGGGSQMPGAAGVTADARTPDFAGAGAVGFGGAIAEDFQSVAAVAGVVRLVGQPFQFQRTNLGTVLRALKVAKLGLHAVKGAVKPLGLGVEAIDQTPNQAFALVGELGSIGAKALGGKVDDLMHDAGQVRVLEPGAKVGQVQRVAGVQVGVLIAAHLVCDAPGALLGKGQFAMGAGLDPVRGFPQGPVVELVRAGGHAEQRGVLASGGGGGLAVAFLSAVVGGLDGGGFVTRFCEGVGHRGFGVGVVVGHCRFLLLKKTRFPPGAGWAASQAFKVRRSRRPAPEGPQRSEGPAKRVAGRRCGPGMARRPNRFGGKPNHAAARQGGDKCRRGATASRQGSSPEGRRPRSGLRGAGRGLPRPAE